MDIKLDTSVLEASVIGTSTVVEVVVVEVAWGTGVSFFY